jgi:hypothetical protein
MSGGVLWEQIIFVMGVLFTVSCGVAAAVWKFAEYLKYQRHDFRSQIEHRTVVFSEKLEELEKHYEGRIHALEMFNSSLAVVLKQVETFQSEVKLEFAELREERKEDMRLLHERFDTVNERFLQLIRGVKYVTPDPGAEHGRD